MNSVLLIGNKHFTSSVIAQVRGLDIPMTTVVTTAAEAIKMMEHSGPDVVIVQACQLLENSILRTFSQERHSAYFIVIDQPAADTHDLEGLSECYIESKVVALESGADAYVWLLPAERNTRLLSGGSATKAVNSFGALTGQLMTPIMFRKSQRRLIQAYIQIGLNRAQRYRNLSRINDWLSAVALVDALTQLNNRRAFDLELPRQITMARTKAAPLSLMVVDIDFFKSVNDRYGHLVGDDVLKLLAKRLLANMRFYDTPFRYGGEEFVITLSNTDIKEGLAIAERLRQSIDQTPFAIPQVFDKDGQLPLTVSIGMTELREDDDPQGRSFLHRADQCLLQAKESGRNQVINSLDD